MCRRINTIIVGLTTWTEKCVVSIQSWIKCVSMEGNVMGFFGGKNVLELLNSRWVLQWRWTCGTLMNVRTWQPPPSPSTAFNDWFWFCHNLTLFFLAFSRVFFMQIDGARPLQCFPRVFGLGFSFNGMLILCWFCDYKLFLGFWIWSCKVWI